jgi:hypothetical protein
MWSDAPERLLHLFAQLSGDESMLAPQRHRASANDDIVAARAGAHERAGYVTASGARAFLAHARSSLNELAARSDYDLETRRHLAGLTGDSRADPIGPDPDADGLAALHTALEEAGLLEPPPERLLLVHEASSTQLPIVKLLQVLAGKDAAEFEARGQELAYLGSVLIAGIAGDGTALSPADARNAVLATCNLGLQTLQSRGERVRIGREPGLVRLFLVGFSVLSTLPGRVAESFMRRLKLLRKTSTGPLHEWLVEEAEGSVTDLNEAVGQGNFAAAREAMMALCFVFGPLTCMAIVPLLDELPRQAAADGAAATWIDGLAALARAVDLLRDIAPKQRR